MWENLIGKKIAKYKIIRKLGEGGYGVTFEAIDDIQGKVAIKFIKPQDGSNWKKEAIKAARVRDIPQIATVFAIDEVDIEIDGKTEHLNYIVWEYVEGTPLEYLLIQEKPLSSSTIVDLTQEICKGIKGMQEADLEHGDLHANNIIFVPPKDWDPIKKYTIKIVDFGLARSAGKIFTSDMTYLKEMVLYPEA